MPGLTDKMASRCRWVTTGCFGLKLTVIYAAKRPCLAPPGRPRCECYATPDVERRAPRHPTRGCTSLCAPRRQVRRRRSRTGSRIGPAILCPALHMHSVLPYARDWPAGVGGEAHGPGFINRQCVLKPVKYTARVRNLRNTNVNTLLLLCWNIEYSCMRIKLFVRFKTHEIPCI